MSTSDNPYIRTIITDTNARYLGIPIEQLMDKAGRGIAQELIKKYGKTKSYTIVCGIGNNGGDGFATAYYLKDLGVKDIYVYLVGRISDLKSEASQNFWEKIKKSQGITTYSDAYAKDIIQKDVSVECLLGTGIQGKLHKRFHDVIVRLTKQRTKIVAVDVPAPGYNPDFSISLLYPKSAQATVVDIGMPKEVDLYAGPGEVKALTIPKEHSYKSQNGELLVFGGSDQFHGAPLMAMKAASKLIGSVFYYTTPENRMVAQDMKTGLSEFIMVDDNSLEKYANYANAFLIGPGLEDNLPTKALVSTLLRNFPEKPVVLDAYAISVATDKGLLKNRILTPHRGELRHLFGDENIQKLGEKGLEGKLKRFAVENECYIILKGHTDILFHKNGTVVLNKSGNQGMAKGGTGDVLAGIIAALLTKNDPWTSMKAGTFVNGKAGDILSEKFGYNFSATDLIPAIQETFEWARTY
ncbi:NAD(P)H-hydrate dehydratase [Candidatus Dojkabacteria bacterium]|uniref:ADP-dependent (S)-NAD(P)H-hydrate dehydratase n=1 Tax=Candidatus Dojkabacteria bacterium TaxID=2099670 RepID=A0A955L8F5_9BACT|nr:NAD(P)H-hydrate dehydratase [Candidatus Dojkabacteria bacterium]